MINNVTLTGRLVAAPELRTTTTGKDVCTFKLAVERSYAPQGKEREADFIPCVAWGSTGVFINNHFYKGSMIGVVGSIQTRNYEDKDGNKRTAYEVNVREASFTGEKKSDYKEQTDTEDFVEVF